MELGKEVIKMKVMKINFTPNRIQHHMEQKNVHYTPNLLKKVSYRLSTQRFKQSTEMDMVAQNVLAKKPVDTKMQDIFDKLPKQKQDEYLLFAKLKLENPQT